MEKEWWLDFQNDKFLNPEDGGYLKVRVLSDNKVGDYAATGTTIITFDTETNGGNDIELNCSGGLSDQKMRGFKGDFGTVNIILHGGLESDDFFEAMRNLVKAYDMRHQLGG